MKRFPTGNGVWPLVRFIAPIFPEVNIFSRIKIPPLGLVNVATAASRGACGWRVEIIDENDYRGPRDANGLPDHEQLQKKNPASVVGFYCGLSSTMDRVFELSHFYRERGTVNIAGGWHAHYCPDEALDNCFDVVVHGDGETVIQQILAILKNGEKLADIPGISFWENGAQKRNLPPMLELPDLSALPYPDFGLLRYPRKPIKIYPIGRIRGCSMGCEFCSVKGKPRWASPEYLFNVVNWLVDKRSARSFFIVDDRLEEDLEGTLEFFRMIREKYGDRLSFTVQIRLEAARNTKFLETMKSAGVGTVCVGYESPIDEDLKAMRKGYLSRHMIEWTKILCRYFSVHAMFIFGYPGEQTSKTLSVEEIAKRFKAFIRKAWFHTIMVVKPIPLAGTLLRKRLEQEGRIFSLEDVGWRYYDGNYPCFWPENMNLKEFQETPIKIMGWFYSPFSFWRIPVWIFTFPIHCVLMGYQSWYRVWHRDIVRYGGHLLVRRWLKRYRTDDFVAKLESCKAKMNVE